MTLTIQLLGPPRLIQNGELLKLSRRKSLALLAFLAVTQQPQSRETIMALLWPALDDSAARMNLRRDLSWLRRQLSEDVLVADRLQVEFELVTGVSLDVYQFEAARQAVQEHAHPDGRLCAQCVGSLKTAVALVEGEFMAGFSLSDCAEFDEWLFFQREHYRQEVSGSLRQLVTWCEAEGAFSDGINYGRTLMALDPWHEPTHRALMRLYALADQPTAALRQYEECVRILDEELGVEPEPETAALFEAIRTREFGSRRRSEKAEKQKSVNGVERVEHHLPTPATAFVGREKELAQLAEMLVDSEKRLITVVGAGGMGKTRLALAAATAIRDAFPHAAHFIPLAAVTVPEQILTAMAEVLSVRLSSDDPQKQLLKSLRDKHLLLLLDNFEHLLAGSGLVAEILQVAPYVKLLVTSRERLNLTGELVLLLAGLDVAEEGTAVHASSAAQLLQQHLQLVRPGADFQVEEMGHVHRICRLTQGMPLALILAASWADTLPIAEIAQEIQRSLDFLTTDMVDVPQRQRSIRAVFEASWRQLTAAQQQLFPKLSFFQGGFSREAAEAVAQANLRDLRTLVNKALLTIGEDNRYYIHELLRQYGAEQLAQDPAAVRQTQNAHAAYYLHFLYDRRQDLWGRRQGQAVAEIKQELDNIRTAWSWAVVHVPPEIFQGACEGLGLFYQHTGGYLEGLRLFTEATEILQGQTQSEANQRSLLRTLIYSSLFNLRFGRLEAVEQAVAQFQAIYERLRIPFLPSLLSDPATHLSFVALIRGDYETAVGYAEQARQTATAQRHLVNDQYACHLLSEAYIGLGDYETARQFAQKAYALTQKSGDSWMRAYLLNSMGQLAVALDDRDTAKAHFQTSYELRQAQGDPAGMALTLNNLGHLALKEGDWAEAERHFTHSHTLYQEVNDNGGLAAANRGLGMVACTQGHYEAARQHYRQALQLSVAINYRPLLMALLVNVAELLWTLGQRERPLRLLNFAAQHPASDHETRHTAAQQLAAWETAVSAQIFADVSQHAQTDDLAGIIDMLHFELA